jgi:hypothetical protein
MAKSSILFLNDNASGLIAADAHKRRLRLTNGQDSVILSVVSVS